MGGVVDNKGDSVTCFHGEHQSNDPLATVKFPCHFFFFEGQGGTQSATGPSTPEFGDPRKKSSKMGVDIHSWLENGPFEDVYPIENGDIPLLCLPEGI